MCVTFSSFWLRQWITCIRPVNRKIVKYVHIHIQAYTHLYFFSLTVLFTGPCILSNGEVIKYHIFSSVVVIELSVRCLNSGPEDRLLLCMQNNIRRLDFKLFCLELNGLIYYIWP